MGTKTYEFDIAEYLKSPEDIRAFLDEVAATGTDSDFIKALGTAARAKGMTKLAEEVGVAREGLYKSLSEDGNPKFITVSKLTRALGYRLAVV
ncbi:MAG: putative addiction module antidote protein [Desulfobulbaceae bacterium]|nr:putative addiction module antidote protein [Desulfobulbaceae bacterium]